MVKVISTHEEYQTIIKNDKTSVVMFTAAWCNPCKVIKPVFQSLSQTFATSTFGIVDVDVLKDTAEYAGISSMPTFQFYRNSKKIHELKGANKEGLETIVNQLFKESNIESSPVPGYSDLSAFISNQVEGLNVDKNYPIQNIFKNDESFIKRFCFDNK